MMNQCFDRVPAWLAVSISVIAVGAAITYFVAAPPPAKHAELPWTATEIDRSKLEGESIGRSLLHFRNHEGRWPQSLDELQAAESITIIGPTAGRPKWSYRAQHNKAVLEFGTWFYTAGSNTPDAGCRLVVTPLTIASWECWDFL